MLGDSDTLASRKISDGSAVHLFQKPKIAPSAVTPSSSSGGLSTASAQQPGRLHEFPPVLMDRGRGGLGGGSGAMGRPDWEVEGPRKQIRCLASFLLLISIIQVFTTHLHHIGFYPAQHQEQHMYIEQAARAAGRNDDCCQTVSYFLLE